MIQFGMRVHDLCGKGSITEVLDKVQELDIHYVQLAMSKSFNDVDTSVGHYNAGLGDYVGEELRKRDTEAFEKTKVQRTREGNAFEMATALILVCSVVVGVATHTFEQRTDILPEYLCFFIGAIAGLIWAYHPMSVFSVALSDSITNVEQFKLLIRRHRVLAVEFALIALTFSICPEKNKLQVIAIICILLGCICTHFLFSFLHKKNK